MGDGFKQDEFCGGTAVLLVAPDEDNDVGDGTAAAVDMSDGVAVRLFDPLPGRLLLSSGSAPGSSLMLLPVIWLLPLMLVLVLLIELLTMLLLLPVFPLLLPLLLPDDSKLLLLLLLMLLLVLVLLLDCDSGVTAGCGPLLFSDAGRPAADCELVGADPVVSCCSRMLTQLLLLLLLVDPLPGPAVPSGASFSSVSDRESLTL
jgi:hypothetical protein